MSPHWTVNLCWQQKGLWSHYESLQFGDCWLMSGGKMHPWTWRLNPTGSRMGRGTGSCLLSLVQKVSLPCPKQMFIHHRAHRKKITWALRSFTLLAVPSPSTPQPFMACFCAAIGRSRTVRCWAGSNPAQSCGHISATAAEMLLISLEMRRSSSISFALLCKLPLVLHHPFLHTSAQLH